MVRRRRIRPHGRGRGRLPADNPNDDQCYRIIDVRNPSKPVEVGRWWLPGTREGDNVPPPVRHTAPLPDIGLPRPQHQRLSASGRTAPISAISTAAMIILDIADKAHAAGRRRWDHSPPYSGFTHTRGAVLQAQPADRHRRVDRQTAPPTGRSWCGSSTTATRRNPIPIATCPLPPLEAFAERGGRFGAHNLHENMPTPHCWYSDDVVLGTFFNGGLRAYDLANPYQPKEIAVFVPPAAAALALPAPSSSTTCSSTSARSSTPSTAWRRALLPGDGVLMIRDRRVSSSPPPCGEGPGAGEVP